VDTQEVIKDTTEVTMEAKVSEDKPLIPLVLVEVKACALNFD
jgi:hypothetical protein